MDRAESNKAIEVPESLAGKSIHTTRLAWNRVAGTLMPIGTVGTILSENGLAYDVEFEFNSTSKCVLILYKAEFDICE